MQTTRTILMALPSHGFDPSEAAIPWQLLTAAGFRVLFATDSGQPARADPIMITGEGLDPWGFIPVLKKIKMIGLMMRAGKAGRQAYQQMVQDPDFCQPLHYDQLQPEHYAGLILPGGHDKSIRPYLESTVLQDFISAFFLTGKPVAAICHGVVLLSRCRHRVTGLSVLHGYQTTSLPWDMEKKAWRLCQFFARFWDPHYYRTYLEKAGEPPGYRSVEYETKRALRSADDFLQVSHQAPHAWRKRSGFFRDSPTDSRPAFVVQDRHYLSARWPGDAHTFTRQFIDLLAHAANQQMNITAETPEGWMTP